MGAGPRRGPAAAGRRARGHCGAGRHDERAVPARRCWRTRDGAGATRHRPPRSAARLCAQPSRTLPLVRGCQQRCRAAGDGVWRRLSGGTLVRWSEERRAATPLETSLSAPGPKVSRRVPIRCRASGHRRTVWVWHDGRSEPFQLLDRDTLLAEHIATLSRGGSAAGGPEIRASMPGDRHRAGPGRYGGGAGATLVTVEAMKMEHSMLASVAGDRLHPRSPSAIKSGRARSSRRSHRTSSRRTAA